MVTEAGGTLSYFDGSPFQLASKEILATNGRIYSELVQLFADVFAGSNIGSVVTPQEFMSSRVTEVLKR